MTTPPPRPSSTTPSPAVVPEEKPRPFLTRTCPACGAVPGHTCNDDAAGHYVHMDRVAAQAALIGRQRDRVEELEGLLRESVAESVEVTTVDGVVQKHPDDAAIIAQAEDWSRRVMGALGLMPLSVGGPVEPSPRLHAAMASYPSTPTPESPPCSTTPSPSVTSSSPPPGGSSLPSPSGGCAKGTEPPPWRWRCACGITNPDDRDACSACSLERDGRGEIPPSTDPAPPPPASGAGGGETPLSWEPERGHHPEIDARLRPDIDPSWWVGREFCRDCAQAGGRRCGGCGRVGGLASSRSAPPAVPAGPGPFAVGDPVAKVGGDYRYEGHVRAVVVKASGATRYVVEDPRGILFIFAAGSLRAAALTPTQGPSSPGGASGPAPSPTPAASSATSSSSAPAASASAGPREAAAPWWWQCACGQRNNNACPRCRGCKAGRPAVPPVAAPPVEAMAPRAPDVTSLLVDDEPARGRCFAWDLPAGTLELLVVGEAIEARVYACGVNGGDVPEVRPFGTWAERRALWAAMELAPAPAPGPAEAFGVQFFSCGDDDIDDPGDEDDSHPDPLIAVFPPPAACPECNGETFKTRGKGMDIEFWYCPRVGTAGHLTLAEVQTRVAALRAGRFA